MSWKPQGSAARFARLMEAPADQVPLDEALLLVAAQAHPDLDVGEVQGRLDDMAADCEPTFESLWRRLFVEIGFSGDPAAYHDPAGSFLDSVVERRTGLPITLSVVAMEVGRRAGVVIEGVGMPHHFLARHRGPEPVLFDPFNGGARLAESEAGDLYRSLTDASLHPAHLGAVTPRQIVDRTLANLKRIYTEAGDRPSLAWVLELRTYVPGTPLSEHAQLAGVLAGLGRARDAADLLDQLAPRLPGKAATRAEQKAALLRATLN